MQVILLIDTMRWKRRPFYGQFIALTALFSGSCNKLPLMVNFDFLSEKSNFESMHGANFACAPLRVAESNLLPLKDGLQSLI